MNVLTLHFAPASIALIVIYASSKASSAAARSPSWLGLPRQFLHFPRLRDCQAGWCKPA
jgi:hypothetical protein